MRAILGTFNAQTLAMTNTVTGIGLTSLTVSRMAVTCTVARRFPARTAPNRSFPHLRSRWSERYPYPRHTRNPFCSSAIEARLHMLRFG